ncbi:MAG: OB-fold domain-containing protein [Gammaproteobacteria bacterium]|nr:OB-fold domain-containing protein [Gammaproteobacteria bacterium]
MTQVSINDTILDISGDGPRLKGMRCKTCDNHVFPFQKGCPKCAGTDVEPKDLGTRGTLWAWTIQGFPPKAPPYLGETDPEKFKPFGIGYVELPGEARVETRLTESDPTKLKEGMEMELTLEPVGKDEDGNDIVTYAFKPI